MSPPRLIHLNGPPGVGKSALAWRWADEHPGTLDCDIDRLRMLIGGWESSHEAAGLIRTAALAMITSYLSTGHDVVLPQTIGMPEQLNRFRLAASEAGAGYVCVMLTVDLDEAVRRFHERDRASAEDDAWARYVRGFFGGAGGDVALRRAATRLGELAAEDQTIVSVQSTDPETTYRSLLVALGEDV